MNLRIFIFLFFIIRIGFSQNSKFSSTEFETLYDKSRGFIYSNIDSSFYYSYKIEKLKNPLYKSSAFGIQSYLFQLKGDSIKSKELYKNAIAIINSIKENSVEKKKINAYILNFGGLADWKRGSLKNAIDKYEEGKKLATEANDIIQAIKFNNNIASIYADINKYNLAIKLAKESNFLTDKFSYLYKIEKYKQSKSTVNYKLGYFYEKKFLQNNSKKIFLDSAEYFYKEVIAYSESSEINNINAKINLGRISYQKREYNKAEKTYLELLKDDNNLLTITNKKYLTINLGELYFNQKKYNNALAYFQKIDSIQNVAEHNEIIDIYSNFYQAKIYNIIGNNKKAVYHSKLFIDKQKKILTKYSFEEIEVNFDIAKKELINEIELIRIENNRKVIINKLLIYSSFITLIGIIIFLIYKNKKRKQANIKAQLIIEAFRIQNIEEDKKNINSNPIIESKENENSISIDEVKEEEIIKKLKELEVKKAFTSNDFTSHNVAKKIKTNTTYLSFVVNKRFGKSFSEYSNELKMNYIINELIINPTFRKYSTQALAESIGYKTANSFTKSFKKKTGITPVQFVQKIETTN